MSNRQPPSDPNLDRDLWGDDDLDDRPEIDLKRKASDDLEESNWDDADDYGREYEEAPGYSMPRPKPAAPAEVPDEAPYVAADRSDADADRAQPVDAARSPEPEPEYSAIDRDPASSSIEPETPPPADLAASRPVDVAPNVAPEPEPPFEPETGETEINTTQLTSVAPPPENVSPPSEPDLPESETVSTPEPKPQGVADDELAEVQAAIAADRETAQLLRQEVLQLQSQKDDLQRDLQALVRNALQDLETRRQNLEADVDRLERRQARLKEEMKTTFAGASQELAVRVQGFKEYLVGSLQDLSIAAERLQLTPAPPPIAAPTPAPPASTPRPRRDRPEPSRSSQNYGRDYSPSQGQPYPSPAPRPSYAPQPSRERPVTGRPPAPSNRPPARSDRGDRGGSGDANLGKQGFQERANFIEAALVRYRDRPDYYGPPWQLRRTFQPVQAERVSDWFFSQGGRGVVRSMGSRLQNILIASTSISILRGMHDKRLRTLVLANSPERLGEWRRGLQDCLGITRDDFGPDRGITLFEDPMLMAQKAERLIKAGWLPLIVMDESEAQLNLSLLQFPLWLAFASDPTRSQPQNFDHDWLVR